MADLRFLGSALSVVRFRCAAGVLATPTTEQCRCAGFPVNCYTGTEEAVTCSMQTLNAGRLLVGSLPTPVVRRTLTFAPRSTSREDQGRS
jgi:hypothetical protein